MTENLPPDDAAPTGDAPPPATPPRRFLRSREDRVLSGVCGGLGAYFGIDAILVRLAMVALVFFGGAGVLLYAAAAVFVPAEGSPGAAGPPRPTDRNRVLVGVGLVLLVLVVGPILLVPAGIAAALLVPLGFLVLAGVAVAWLVTGRAPGRDAGSIARAALLGLGVLVLLGCLAVGAFWAAGLGGEAVVAALVIAAGAAVLLGAFVRPVRWLILPALTIAIPAGFVSAAGIELDGGYGERSYRPVDASQLAPRYELAAGELTLDLRGMALPPGDRALDIDVGMGQAVLIVPEDVCVATRARVGMGQIDLFDRGNGGVDVDVEDTTRARRDAPRLVVDADIGLGHLDVRHTAPAWADEFGWDGNPRPPRDPAGELPELDDERPGNTACAGATS